MERQSEQPFDSIESAYDFLRILSEAITDTKGDIDAQIQGQIQRDSGSLSLRRLDALRVVYYSVEKLEFHTNCSRRILNDLRSLRRLLFEERAVLKEARASEPVEALAPKMPEAAVPAQLSSEAVQPSGKNSSAVAA